MLPAPAAADEKAQLFVSQENGFGRMILSFPDRLDLPPYRLKFENGVLAVEFDEPVDVLLPDVAAALPDYMAVGRVDPDKKGVRFGLRKAYSVNRMEAGEKLFIDLLPAVWEGLPPSLPEDVVAALAERAKEAAKLAEQKRKAEEAKTLKPVATLRVGRNPTFLRVQFDWNVDTEAKFAINGDAMDLAFDWPVPVDLYALKADLPVELVGALNIVGADGSHVVLRVADGVVPRFYATSTRQFIVDIDIARDPAAEAAAATGNAVAQRSEQLETALKEATEREKAAAGSTGKPGGPTRPSDPQGTITPVVSMIGATVRVAFPFEEDTAAAVFRRGDTVWMLFDTPITINNPLRSDALNSIANNISIIPEGETKIVRLDLADDRLATLGSEGRSWVLSLGDVLLNPTEPLTLRRRRDENGQFAMTADLQRPGTVHRFQDPVVGDVLDVVTAFPPARGVARNLAYVDFATLPSIHGLVIKPENEDLDVAVAGKDALIIADGGLTLSAVDDLRMLDAGNAPEFRNAFMDLKGPKEDDPAKLVERREAIMEKAAESEGRRRDMARLELAQFYVANRFAPEALGVLEVLETELQTEDLKRKIHLARGIANTLAVRPADAIAELSGDGFAEEVDALMWRSIAKVQAADYVGARLDAAAAQSVIDSYPAWVRTKFLLSGIRAAVETHDTDMALRYFEHIEFAKLDPEQITDYQLLQGRLAEAEGRTDEALDAYGQVIAADVRPTRAEAVYRTLSLLDQTGRIDLAKATETLSTETMLWRGDLLEASMQKLLAELYFRHKDYRLGFETVKQSVAFYPENASVNALLKEAQGVFGQLYLDGQADELTPVDALSLYYDFRQLTPPGNRGDEMIRNLARRLVKVDLLKQAGDLLEYQIDGRLKGVAQAQIAADLAVIRIADRDPEGALRVLNHTRLADLSPSLERQRRILEARALIDAGREELAIDLLSKVRGKDADLLRVDGYWKAKNYTVAAELLEAMYSPGQDTERLTQVARMNLVKAGVGFVLGSDRLGLSRLRSKFGDQMAQSPEWRMFDFVTGDTTPSSVEFRKVASEVSGLDSLNAFLASYREMYAAGDTMTPAEASKPDAA